jgi:hypothetical protein
MVRLSGVWHPIELSRDGREMTVMPRGDYIDIAALLCRHKNPQHIINIARRESELSKTTKR